MLLPHSLYGANEGRCSAEGDLSLYCARKNIRQLILSSSSSLLFRHDEGATQRETERHQAVELGVHSYKDYLSTRRGGGGEGVAVRD